MKLFVLPLLAILLASSVLACSCIAPVSIEESFNGAEMVFAGTVTSISQEDYSRKVAFTVDTTWKTNWKDANAENAAMKGPTFIFTGRDSAGCGYEFEEGKRYLVYATRNDDGTLFTSLCSRTKLYAEASEDLAFLGTGTDVTSEPNNPDPERGWFSRVISYLVNLFR